jgi:hypothetical protein
MIIENDSSVLWVNADPIGKIRFGSMILMPYKLQKIKKLDNYSLQEIASTFLGRWQINRGKCDPNLQLDSLTVPDISREDVFSNESIISKTYFKETNYTKYDGYKWSVGDTGRFIRIKYKSEPPSIYYIKEINANKIILENSFCESILVRKE